MAGAWPLLKKTLPVLILVGIGIIAYVSIISTGIVNSNQAQQNAADVETCSSTVTIDGISAQYEGRCFQCPSAVFEICNASMCGGVADQFDEFNNYTFDGDFCRNVADGVPFFKCCHTFDIFQPPESPPERPQGPEVTGTRGADEPDPTGNPRTTTVATTATTTSTATMTPTTTSSTMSQTTPTTVDSETISKSSETLETTELPRVTSASTTQTTTTAEPISQTTTTTEPTMSTALNSDPGTLEIDDNGSETASNSQSEHESTVTAMHGESTTTTETTTTTDTTISAASESSAITTTSEVVSASTTTSSTAEATATQARVDPTSHATCTELLRRGEGRCIPCDGDNYKPNGHGASTPAECNRPAACADFAAYNADNPPYDTYDTAGGDCDGEASACCFPPVE